MSSSNKPAALAKCRYVTELRIQRLNAMQKRMDNLIKDYDIDREFDYLQDHDEDLYTIKEKLVFAFPGNYGLFIALHFGRFLNETIDTDEKRKAYDAIIRYLDNVNLYLSSELSEFLETFFIANEKIDMEKLEKESNDKIMEMLADTENYLERNHKEIEQYIEIKNSDEFKNSVAGKLQKSILNFQRQSGYKGILIANMKILSKSYAEYLKKLEAANEIMLKKYPKARLCMNQDSVI
ncbi:MAG: MerR family transcriptional regulator [Clostridiales bacterium]|nr:MerR family transcriptional regulator [Clostridiales bacterium]